VLEAPDAPLGRRTRRAYHGLELDARVKPADLQGPYHEALLKVSPMATVMLDRGATVTSWNPAAEELFGYSRDEAVGRRLDELVAATPELRAEAIRLSEAAEKSRTSVVTRRSRKDGTFVDVEVVAAPVLSDGVAIGHIAIYHDVSALRQAAEAQREAEERYRDLIEHLPLVTYIDEPTETAPNIYTSPQVEALVGTAPDEWVADRDFFPKLLHPDDRERVIADHAKALASGAPSWSFEYRLLARDGRTVWIRDDAVVVRDNRGKPLYTQGFMLDITERKQAEEALRRSEEEVRRQKQYYQTLLEISPTAVVTLDLDERVTSWNPAAEQLFGWTEAEAVGREIDDLVLGTAELREEGEAVTDLVSEEGSAHLISRRSRKDGSLVEVEILMVPLAVGGQPSGFYVIYHDIGDLQRARHEAEAATQAKSVFLATMSHEIRTPMNAVIGMTELLLDTELDQEQRGFTEMIRSSGDALLRMIDDVLDFSKIESGKLELERRPFELRECVESALELVAARAAEKGLELGCLIAPDVPTRVIGDVTRLRQVLINLVSNGVKFTEEGEVVVLVEREGSLPEGHRLHIAVRDTGIGIPAHRIGELFQHFSQAEPSTSRRFGGSGLGLAISKRLSELMGGTMWVDSTPGQGSTFHFTCVVEEAPVRVPQDDRKDQLPLRGKRVLIADDNATNREIVVRQTRSWGMLPRATERPSEALAWVQRGDPFDVAILDMQMPEMDGLALARGIRGQPAGRNLPLVLLSSLGPKGRIGGAREFAVTLTKPVRASQLHRALVGIVAKGAAQQEEPEASAVSGHGPAATSGLRILVAEDNAVNQKLAVGLLAKLGHKADMVGNGAEALEAVASGRYDVVLMDVQMPELDGLEATRRIRRRRSHHQPRIIAMTANVIQGDREECLEAGMDDYLAKPIRVPELRAALERARRDPALQPDAAVAVDEGALDELRAEFGDEGDDFVDELIETFLGEGPELVAALLRGVDRGNAEEVRRAAHTLKTNAQTLGREQLASVCRKLEQLGRENALDSAGELAARVEVEYHRLELALGAARTGAAQ
jgi:PAS domain S-box-containing protein